ncbi:MAG: uroporphyrinogen-III synthase [Firmicutes bacterium]|nr:uroporphyrinogen-III synthase [Bacillota bacterium]
MNAPAHPLWLVAAGCGDPNGVPESARLAMAAAERVVVLPGAPPALALWARPECVRAGAGEDEGREGQAAVWIAPAPPDRGRARALPGLEVARADCPPMEDAPLREATVVLTRPWPDLQLTASAYAARGARVVPWPLSTIVPPPDPAALAQAASRCAAGAYDAVGVTSARAAAAWCEAVLGASAEATRRPFLAAVGEATAAALLMGGLTPDLVTEGGGSALGEALGERAKGGRVLLVAAAAGRTEAEDAARAAGAQVDVVAAYGMADPPWRQRFDPWVSEALQGPDPRCVYVTWFSPRAVERGLRALGSALARATWVVVGETTAQAARRLASPAGGIEVAERASEAAVREAIVRLHRTRRRRP